MSTPSNRNDEKFKALNEGLQGEYILAHLNTKKNPELKLPAHLLEPNTVTLKLSFYFEGQMELKKDHIEANLRFGENYFTCIIPYDAIWGVTSDQGQNTIWSEDIPAELLKNQTEQQEPLANKKPEPAAEPEPATNNKVKKLERKKAPRPNHLKRIK